MRRLAPPRRGESLAFDTMSITQKLIDDCKRDRTPAQLELFRLCYPRLMPVCRRYVREHDVSEMLNIGFFKVLKGLHKYEYKDEVLFMQWACRVLINAIIDEIRSRKRYQLRHTSVDNVEINGFAREATFNTADLELDTEHIHAMINKLPEGQKRVFNLYVVDAYSHKEIGTMLEMSETTSRWYLAQARKALQAMLAEYAQTSNKIKA